MICKKCGANIADTAKFCGYCGGRVEELNIESVNNSQNVNPVEQTRVVEPVNAISNNNQNNHKKSNAWIFITGGILLGLVILVLLFIVFISLSNKDVKTLERAFNNIEEKGENSGTINAKLVIETDTNDMYNLSATVKYAKKYDSYDMSLTLNKSLLYDEMNFYSTITEDNMTLYVKSSLIDMLGMTSSTDDMWIYYLLNFNELGIEEVDEVDGDIDLSDILDRKHYKYVDEENGIKHYTLIIDNELLNNIKSKADQEDLREFEQSMGDIENIQLTETYYVDIYINNYNELVKISMDLTDYMDDVSITGTVISFEFINFGSTMVEIPSDAKNSIIDLESYMSSYSNLEDSIDQDSSTDEYYYDYNTDYYESGI